MTWNYIYSIIITSFNNSLNIYPDNVLDPDKSSHSVLGPSQPVGSSPGGPSQIGGPSFTYNSGAFQQGFGLGVTGRQPEPPPGGQGPLGQVGFGHSSLGQGVAPGPFGQGPLAQGPLGKGPLAQVYSFDELEEKFPPLGQSLDRSGYRNI